jgi:membrane dipeptidase
LVAIRPRAYAGYRSYDYLKPGRDYEAFALAPEVGRVPETRLAVDPAQEARAMALMERGPVVSLHEHPIVLPRDIGQMLDYRRQGRDVTGFAGLAASGLDVVCDALANGEGTITSLAAWKWDDTILDLGMRLADLAHQDFVVPVRTMAELSAARARGQLAWIASLEALTPIENEIDRIDVLYGLGVRLMGIAYNEANALGAGFMEPNDAGLTLFGRRCVRRLNDLGAVIDVSHCGDRTARDVIERSAHPVFMTHDGARGLWNHRRLKPDDLLRACAERGGVVGIMAAPNITPTRARPVHDLEAYMQHFEYCANLIGIDHVAFGPDTFFGDHVGMMRAFGTLPPLRQSLEDYPYQDDAPERAVDHVAGVENPAEAFPNFARWLVGHGYSDEQILKAMGGNVLRVLGEVWGG